MLRTHWRTWLLWSASCAMLVGIGFALHATLPPQPRFVLRGPNEFGSLSPDGTILSVGVKEDADENDGRCVALKVYDSAIRADQGEFFRGLIGSQKVGFAGPGEQAEALANAFQPGFSIGSLVFSRDKRYCALLHHDGLALADLHSGREWQTVVKSKFVKHFGPETVVIQERLRQVIDTRGFHNEVKFKVALELLSDRLGGNVAIVVDREAFADELGTKAPDPFEEIVCLPEFPSKLQANVALRILQSQIGGGSATFIIRRNHIEITTKKNKDHREVWPPVFSQGGSFVALAEQDATKSTLHVVECATGELIVSLPTDYDACANFAFTRDETRLCFFVKQAMETVLAIWDVKQKQIVRSFKNVSSQNLGFFTPDGEDLLADNELLNLRTGLRRPAPGEFSYWTRFSPDGRTLVRKTAEKLQIWDLPSNKIRHEIKVHWLQSPVVISADSRVVVCEAEDKPQSFVAWDVKTGARLWPPPEPEPAPANNGEVEIFLGRGLVSRAEMSPRFTPDHRFLIERKENRINMLDPATGKLHASLVMARDAKEPAILGITPDGRWMVSQWDYAERKPWFGEEWLAKLLPIRKTVGCIVISDTETGRVRLQVNRRESDPPTAVLSDDGSTLMTCMWHGDSIEVACWDVPGRPSMPLVVGIPLALGCIALLVRWRWTRKRTVPQTAAPV